MRSNKYKFRFICNSYCVLFIISCFLFFAPPASAQDEVNITADNLEFLSKTNTLTARGSVTITFDDATLHADEMQLNNMTYDAVAVGNVLYNDKESVIHADKIDLNLKTKLGTIYNSHMNYIEQNIHLRGDTITKTGEKSFHLEKAEVTACDAEPPAWHFSGQDIAVAKDESVKGWKGIFYIKNIPVLYTPYFYAPLLKTRQTGFLFPSFGYSNSRGTYYKQGFFWAAKENQDATYYLDYYSKKGIAGGLDYRYILSPETTGELWLYNIHDKNPSRNLFEIKSYHNQKFPYDIAGYLKIHSVSHSDYYQTMDSTSAGRIGLSEGKTDPYGFTSEERLQKFVESNLQLSRSFYSGRAYLLAQGRQSLEGPSREIPQNLPEVALILNTRTKNNFSFNMSAKANNFVRKEGQGGFRFDLNPNVYWSYGRVFNITQKIGFRETSYILNTPSKNETRILFDSRTTMTTKFFKRYSRFLHILEPSLEYQYIPDTDHDDLPFFDSIDSIPHTSSLNYALTNRLSGLNSYNLDMRFRLSQSYSLLNVEKHFTPLLAEAVFNSDQIGLTMNASYDVHDGNISETIAEIKYDGDKYNVAVGKNFRRATELSQYTFAAGIKSPIKILNAQLPIDLYGKIWYDVTGHGVQELDIRSTYHEQCWGLLLNFNKRPNEYQIIFAVEFKGLGTFSLGSI